METDERTIGIHQRDQLRELADAIVLTHLEKGNLPFDTDLSNTVELAMSNGWLTTGVAEGSREQYVVAAALRGLGRQAERATRQADKRHAQYAGRVTMSSAVGGRPHIIDARIWPATPLGAPCSGEGLLQFFSDKKFICRSAAQIKRLQQLQKKAIAIGGQLLEPAGAIIYSTRTIAPQKYEAVIAYLLRRHADASLGEVIFRQPNRTPALRA